MRRDQSLRFMSGACLWDDRNVLQTGGFIQSEHQVHALYALTSRAFDQVILYDEDHQRVAATGAMHRDEKTGAVLSDPDKCVGCWMCIMTCPVGAVHRGADRRVASKCDLCIGEATPACGRNIPKHPKDQHVDHGV